MIFEFCGFSGSGKTTLVKEVIRYLALKNMNFFILDEWFWNLNKIRKIFMIFRYAFIGFVSIYWEMLFSSKCSFSYIKHLAHHITITKIALKKACNTNIILSEGFSTLIPNLSKLNISKKTIDKLTRFSKRLSRTSIFFIKSIDLKQVYNAKIARDNFSESFESFLIDYTRMQNNYLCFCKNLLIPTIEINYNFLNLKETSIFIGDIILKL